MSQPMPSSTEDWNNLFNLAAYIAVMAVAIVMVAMVYFAIKYRERKGQPKFIPQIGLSKKSSQRSRDFRFNLNYTLA